MFVFILNDTLTGFFKTSEVFRKTYEGLQNLRAFLNEMPQ